jgi:hypothetical protein
LRFAADKLPGSVARTAAAMGGLLALLEAFLKSDDEVLLLFAILAPPKARMYRFCYPLGISLPIRPTASSPHAYAQHWVMLT